MLSCINAQKMHQTAQNLRIKVVSHFHANICISCISVVFLSGMDSFGPHVFHLVVSLVPSPSFATPDLDCLQSLQIQVLPGFCWQNLNEFWCLSCVAQRLQATNRDQIFELLNKKKKKKKGHVLLRKKGPFVFVPAFFNLFSLRLKKQVGTFLSLIMMKP